MAQNDQDTIQKYMFKILLTRKKKKKKIEPKNSYSSVLSIFQI